VESTFRLWEGGQIENKKFEGAKTKKRKKEKKKN
jgi:hypothetical protein